jgi:hypothetical protein
MSASNCRVAAYLNKSVELNECHRTLLQTIRGMRFPNRLLALLRSQVALVTHFYVVRTYLLLGCWANR